MFDVEDFKKSRKKKKKSTFVAWVTYTSKEKGYVENLITSAIYRSISICKIVLTSILEFRRWVLKRFWSWLIWDQRLWTYLFSLDELIKVDDRTKQTKLSKSNIDYVCILGYYISLTVNHQRSSSLLCPMWRWCRWCEKGVDWWRVSSSEGSVRRRVKCWRVLEGVDFKAFQSMVGD